MIAEAEKPAVKSPDFLCRVTRTSRGVMLYVKSAALKEHLDGLAGGAVSVNGLGRSLYRIPNARRSETNLFNLGDAITGLLLDSKLDEGHETRIADVMTATMAREYVKNLMSAFSEYVRDYMAALRITGTVTVDETVL